MYNCAHYAFSSGYANSVWYCPVVYDLKLVNMTLEFPNWFALFGLGPFLYATSKQKIFESGEA